MQITVMQWNVWFKENIERVVHVLREHSADIICMQELTRGYINQTHENTWEYIAHELGYHCQYQEIPIITPDGQWSQANAIFSRFPIIKTSRHWLHEPEDPESPTDQYRGYLEITIDTGDKPLTIATTHLSFTAGPNADQERNQLMSFVDQKTERYVLTGDMNGTPESDTIKALDSRLHNAGPSYDQKTWTTKPYKFGNVDMSTLDWRYDYIFTTADIHAIDSHTIRTDVSDHLPIIATLTVPTPATDVAE